MRYTVDLILGIQDWVTEELRIRVWDNSGICLQLGGALKLQVLEMQVWKSEVQYGGKYKYGKSSME